MREVLATLDGGPLDGDEVSVVAGVTRLRLTPTDERRVALYDADEAETFTGEVVRYAFTGYE